MYVREFGTDFRSTFNFVDGDLELVEDKENIVQSIVNRLNTDEDFFELFYNSYGGVLTSYMGWKATDKTLSFMKLELDTILNQDPRLTDFDSSLEYAGDGKVKVDLFLSYDDESDLSLSFVIGDTVEIEETEDEMED